MAASLQGENAEMMQGLGMTGLRGEDLPVEGLGVGKMAGAVLLDGLGEGLGSDHEAQRLLSQTPVPPGSAISDLHAAGKTWAIHERRRLHPRAQGAAQLGETWKIIREADGDRHKIVFREGG
jgi:hypothetical protein